MKETEKKEGRNLLPVILGAPVAIFLLVVVIARGGVTFGTLFDLAFLITAPMAVIALFRRRPYTWALLGIVVGGLWFADLTLYLKSVPVREPIIMPLIRWIGGIATPDEHGWIIRTVFASLFLWLFVLCLKKRMMVSGMFTGAVLLLCLGFLPLATQRMALATSVAAPPAGVEITPEKIQGLVANRPGQLVDVHASTDNNLTWGRQPLVLERGDILVVQFVDEPDPFYFRNMRRNPEAMRDPSLISGTYSQPCGWKYEDFRGVARSSMPLPKHPLSTTAVRLGPNGYQPLVSEWHLFAATHKGEVNLGYNFPRGLDNHMNSNANGHRRFMIWVIRAAEARASSRK